MRRVLAGTLSAALAISLAWPAGVHALTVPSGWPVPYLSQHLTGLTQPVFVAGDTTGQRTYVVERPGRIRVMPAAGGPLSVFLDISALTTTAGERGLLGLAFPPDYGTSGRFYVCHTRLDGDIVVARYSRDPNDPDAALPGSQQVVLTIEHSARTNHNGGWIGFGPDGYLYVAVGDGGGSGDPDGNAQNRSVLLGKMLRIDVTTGAPATYVVPPSNPFVGVAGVRPEIWDWGLRNPWRNSFDASGTLYIADVGQNAWEEVNVEPAGTGGRNYGWDRWEANAPYPAGSQQSPAGVTFPQVAIAHPTGESVTGGYRYEGTAHPGMRGTYLFGDFVTGRLWGLRRRAGGGYSAPLLAETNQLLASFGTDDAGELYACSFSDGAVYRVGDANTYSRRIAAADRYGMAVAVARDTFPAWSGVTHVVVASGEDRAAADPLTAAGLCWAYDAPLLLTSSRSTPSAVRTALSQIRAANGPITLHIVGGTASVPPARVNELLSSAGAGSTADRVLASGSRYELAEAIAREMQATRPAQFPARALIANGAEPQTFFDALSLSAVAAATGSPVLLTGAATAPTATRRALADLGLTERWAAGGTRTLTPALLASLGVPENRRLAGATRYATSVAVADAAVSRGWLQPARPTFAATLPDSVAGGASAGLLGGPLLVTSRTALGPAATFVRPRRASVVDARVLGGSTSVDDDVRRQLASALEP